MLLWFLVSITVVLETKTPPLRSEKPQIFRKSGGGVLFFLKICSKSWGGVLFFLDFQIFGLFSWTQKNTELFSFPLKKSTFSAKNTPKFSAALRADLDFWKSELQKSRGGFLFFLKSSKNRRGGFLIEGGVLFLIPRYRGASVYII